MVCLEVPKGTWEFQKEVVIGVVDTSAAGSRLLLPLLSCPNAKRAAISVKKTSKWDPSPSFNLKEQNLEAVEVFSLDQTSFVIVNTTVPEEEESTFAFQLTQFILDHRQEETSVTFLFGQDFGAKIKNENSPKTFIRTNKAINIPSFAPLPSDIPLRNGMVASLVHLLSTVEVFSEFSLLVSHGKVARNPSSPDQDGTLEVISRLGDMLSALLPSLSPSLSFDASSLVPASFSPSSSESLMYL